jgi:hypothetical protein
MDEKFQLLSNLNDQPDQFNFHYNAKNYEMATMGSYGTNNNSSNSNVGNTTNIMTTAAATKRQIDSLGLKNNQHDNLDFFSLGMLVSNKTASTASNAFVASDNLSSSSNTNNNQDIILRNQNIILDENRYNLRLISFLSSIFKIGFETFNRLLGINSLSNSQVATQNLESLSEEKINFDNYFIQLLLSYINEQV